MKQEFDYEEKMLLLLSLEHYRDFLRAKIKRNEWYIDRYPEDLNYLKIGFSYKAHLSQADRLFQKVVESLPFFGNL